MIVKKNIKGISFWKVADFYLCIVFCCMAHGSCSLKDTTVHEAGDSPPPPYSEGPSEKCGAAALSSSKSTNQLPRYEDLKPLANGFFI